MNQRGKRQIEKNVRKAHPRRRVQRRAPRAGCVPIGALERYVTEQYRLAFHCRVAGHGPEADAIGVCMKNLAKVLAAR